MTIRYKKVTITGPMRLGPLDCTPAVNCNCGTSTGTFCEDDSMTWCDSGWTIGSITFTGGLPLTRQYARATITFPPGFRITEGDCTTTPLGDCDC